MRTRFLIFLLLVAFTVGLSVRNWQCAEMFPQANRIACILWK